MKLLGLDFDNTLVRYDSLFHKLALEKKLIPETVPKNKTKIRDYLRSKGKDECFTLLQGEVYGLRIQEAEASEGMIETLNKLNKSGIQMVIISHKTRIPYKGPAYDLREAAMGWLEKHRFFEDGGLNLTDKQVIFEDTKESKIERIVDEKCTHYIDDLPEILKKLPGEITRILYDPNNDTEVLEENITRLRDWKKLRIEA